MTTAHIYVYLVDFFREKEETKASTCWLVAAGFGWEAAVKEPGRIKEKTD